VFSFYFCGRSLFRGRGLFCGRGLFGEGSGDIVNSHGFSG
jgi:hypothetical protein